MSRKMNSLPFPRMKRVGYAKFILEADFDITIDGVVFHVCKRAKPYNGRSFLVRDGLRRPAALLHDVVCENMGKLSPDVCSKTLWTPCEASDMYREVCTLYGVAEWLIYIDFNAIRIHDRLFKNWD